MGAAPGRPALFATTKQFLNDLGLQSLDQLPLLEGPAEQNLVLDALAESVAFPEHTLDQLDSVLTEAVLNSQMSMPLGDAIAPLDRSKRETDQ